MVSLEFFIAALVVILVPGTGVIYTVGIALVHKRLSMVYAALGCTLAIIPHLLGSVFGLSALLSTSYFLFNIVKTLGAIYLLYMAYSLFMGNGALKFTSGGEEANKVTITKNGFLVNVLNPKLSIFFLAFIPQFIPKNSDQIVLSMLILGVAFMLITLLVFIFYGFFANLLQVKVSSSTKLINRVQKLFALIFGLLAVKMAYI